MMIYTRLTQLCERILDATVKPYLVKNIIFNKLMNAMSQTAATSCQSTQPAV